jgi:hypothetical protein
MTNGTRSGEWSASRPGRSLPPGKTRYPLYRRLGGHQGRYGQVRKISPSPQSGFDPRTVQPVANRYTDCATRPMTGRLCKVEKDGKFTVKALSPHSVEGHGRTIDSRTAAGPTKFRTRDNCFAKLLGAMS